MTGHGNVNEICAWLLRDYGPDMRLTALIWTAEDVHRCTEGMGTTDDEAETVLADIAAHREHHDTGTDREAVRDMLRRVREEARIMRDVSIPAASLAALLSLAETAIAARPGCITEDDRRHAEEAREALRR